MTDKKTSISLVVLTDVPDMGRVAILQRRGKLNYEKREPESWPDGCQVTTHGKVQEDEELWLAMYRELSEELGSSAYSFIRSYGRLFSDAMIKEREVWRIEDDKKLVITYAVLVPSQVIKLIESFLKTLGSYSGGITLVSEDQIDGIQDLNNFDKKFGVTNRQVIAMFPDEKEAVKKAFEMFK